MTFKKAKVSIPLIVGGLVLVVGTAGVYIATNNEQNVEPNNTSDSNTQNDSNSQEDTSVTTSSDYEDGTYSATGSYTSPAGKESIKVELTLEGNTVKELSVTPQATNPTSQGYQRKFSSGIAEKVVGKPIDSVGNLGSVNGSSLSPKGFMDALEMIKNDAKQ